MSTSSPPVIVRDLRKAYAGAAAVCGVDFTIAAGEIFGLLGPNGAGKTTVVECLIGLREPDTGELQICGIDARRQPQEVKQIIGVALQSTSLQDKITPREALLERFALQEKADAPVDTLSGGQRQRLALALAFVNHPALMVLDEPTTGLDPQARRELHAAIAQLKRDGCTILFTTHYLDEAEALCDRVAIIDRGRIVATGAPRDLVAQSPNLHTVTVRTATPLPADLLAALPGAREISGAGAEGRFQTADATATLAALARELAAHHIDLIDLQVRKASLEDVFLALTRESNEAPEAPR